MSETGARDHRSNGIIWVLGLLLLNSVLVFLILPPQFILDQAPIGFVDFMQHYNHADEFVEMFKTRFATWGYNPKYMAGFPDLTVFDLDSKFLEWFALLGSSLGIKTTVSMKVLIFLEMFIEPFLLFFAFQNFGFRKKAACWACLGGIFILNGPIGLFFNPAGMFSFVFATFLCLLVISLYYRFIVVNNAFLMWLMVVLTAVAPLFHSMAVIMIGIPVLILVMLRIKSLSKRHVLWIGLSFAFSLLINLYWIIPVLKTLKYSIPNDYAWTGEFSILQFIAFWLGGTLFTMGGAFAVIYYGKGLKILREDKKYLASFVCWMTLVLVVMGGPAWYLTRSIQPNRFLILLQALLLIPVIALIDHVVQKKKYKSRKTIAVILVVSLLMPGAGMAWIRFSDPGEAIPLMIAHKLFGRTLGAGNLADPRTQELIQWLNGNTSPEEGRIMLEHPQGEGEESPFFTFYLGLLPAIQRYVNGEFIGAPRFEAPLIQNKNTRFSHNEMFGIPISMLDEMEFVKKLDQYNVKWIVAVKGTATLFLDQYPELVKVIKEIDNVRIYLAEENGNGYFLKGTGTVKAEINKLELSGLNGDDIILKYHWLEGLRAPEGVSIERFPVEGDETGFIRVVNPPSDVVLTFN